MLLFIISEIMIFGAFFTAYFFIRSPRATRGRPGTTIPVAVAGFNTAILVSSSFTLHWAETSIKRGNRFGLRAGILATLLLGATFSSSRSTSTSTSASPARQRPGDDLLRLTGLHGAHVCIGLILLSFATIRSFRGHYSPRSTRG